MLIENIAPPVGVRAIQAANLVDWDGAADAPALELLVRDLKALLDGAKARTNDKVGHERANNGSPTDDDSFPDSLRRLFARHWKTLVGGCAASALLLAALQISWPIRQANDARPAQPASEPPPARRLTAIAVVGAPRELKPDDTVAIKLQGDFSDGTQDDVAGSHELGHAFGLVHNHAKVSEMNTLGSTLMGAGSYAVGQSSFLSAADGAVLNTSQTFNTDIKAYYGPVKASITAIYASYCAAKEVIVISGKFKTDVPVTDVLYFNDPNNFSNPGTVPVPGVNTDYNAVAWTTKPVGADSFYVEMKISDLEYTNDKIAYDLKVKLVHQNGIVTPTTYHYTFQNILPVMDFGTPNEISKQGWSIKSFSSQETRSENGAAANIIDNNPVTYWISRYSTNPSSFPDTITVDMGQIQHVNGFTFLQRQTLVSSVKDLEIQYSVDGNNFSSAGLERSRRFYTEQMLLPEAATLETRHARERGERAVLFAAGKAQVVCVTPSDPDGRAGRWMRRHPDGVAVLGLRVRSVEEARRRLEERGATFIGPIQAETDAQGRPYRCFDIATPLGDVRFRFVERAADALPPGFQPADPADERNPYNLQMIDHVTSNLLTIEPHVTWLRDVMGFEEYWRVHFHTADINPASGGSGLASVVMWDPESGIKMANNEPVTPHYEASQIYGFVEANHGPGVQHVAFHVPVYRPRWQQISHYASVTLSEPTATRNTSPVAMVFEASTAVWNNKLPPVEASRIATYATVPHDPVA